MAATERSEGVPSISRYHRDAREADIFAVAKMFSNTEQSEV